MKINERLLLVSMFIPLFLGSLVGIITSSSGRYYSLNLPSFAPPAVLFPIVWSILYILMGISSYLVYDSDGNSSCKKMALLIYLFQLGMNLLWSFVFFFLHFYLLAFLWIVLLIALVLFMITQFHCVSKLAAYLQIPYLFWLIFAAILNFSILFLN